jgi:hypothetical protein
MQFEGMWGIILQLEVNKMAFFYLNYLRARSTTPLKFLRTFSGAGAIVPIS